MKNGTPSNPLIVRIAKLFDEQLGLENDYLRQENRILRSKLGKRVALTDRERGILAKYGMRIKDRLGEVMSIATPETLLRWNRRMKQKKWTFDNTPKKPGRPRKDTQTEELVARLAKENGWGYRRIAGEMKKQARNFCIILGESSQECRYIIHDRDACFLPFDEIVKTQDIRIVKTPPGTPQCNAFAERHVRECRETLSRMILFGREHLHHVAKKIERHHNLCRPHQGLDPPSLMPAAT